MKHDGQVLQRAASNSNGRRTLECHSKGNYGWTPLALAAGNGHEAEVKLLIARDGVDPGSKSNSGRTPLSLAAEKGHEAVVKLLQSHQRPFTL
jgi:ankyrin repeat protein